MLIPFLSKTLFDSLFKALLTLIRFFSSQCAIILTITAESPNWSTPSYTGPSQISGIFSLILGKFVLIISSTLSKSALYSIETSEIANDKSSDKLMISRISEFARIKIFP